MKKIFLILGKASAGKDSIAKEVSKRLNMPIALSFTTRPMRSGEEQGVEYDFISLDEFMDKQVNKQLAEFTRYKVVGGHIWYYGLTREELEKDDYVIAIVNPDGAKQIKKIYGDKAVTIEIKADRVERIKRYIKRGGVECIGECFRRLLADDKDFENFNPKFTIVNNALETSIKRVEEIIRFEIGKDILLETQEDFKNNPDKFIGENR